MFQPIYVHRNSSKHNVCVSVCASSISVESAEMSLYVSHFLDVEVSHFAVALPSAMDGFEAHN